MAKISINILNNVFYIIQIYYQIDIDRLKESLKKLFLYFDYLLFNTI